MQSAVCQVFLIWSIYSIKLYFASWISCRFCFVQLDIKPHIWTYTLLSIFIFFNFFNSMNISNYPVLPVVNRSFLGYRCDTFDMSLIPSLSHSGQWHSPVGCSECAYFLYWQSCGRVAFRAFLKTLPQDRLLLVRRLHLSRKLLVQCYD